MLVGWMHGDRYRVRGGAGGQRQDRLRFQFKLVNWLQGGLVYGGSCGWLMQVRRLYYLWRGGRPRSQKLLHLWNLSDLMVFAKMLSLSFLALFQVLQ